MGTRSLTVVVDTSDNEEICVLYRQYDGYPGGHGKELAKFLASGKLVNGLGGGTPYRAQFNGVTGLAARIVHHFDPTEGGFYLHAGGTRDCGEEWTYEVRATTPMDWSSPSIKDAPIEVVVKNYDDVEVFRGTPQEMLVWIPKFEDDDSEEELDEE